MAGSTAHIIQSLVINFVIAVAKGIAAVMTGSGSMMAETLHSFADCGNQGLLLMGVHKSRRPPSASHPLGYGRVLYFWSFMVALLLFTGGGMFSIYESVHKLEITVNGLIELASAMKCRFLVGALTVLVAISAKSA